MVVAVSSTADARRGAPVRPAFAAGESAPHARVRAPRPWTASLQRPAAKILVAGGLTLAGWLLGAALSGSTASAAGAPACPEAPAISTVDQAAVDQAAVDQAARPFSHARHRKHHHETGAATCADQPKGDSTEPATDPAADEPPQQTGDTPTAAETTKDTSATDEPVTTKATTSPATEAPKATSSSGNLLGNLVGGVLGTTKDTAPAKATSSGGNLLGTLVGGVVGATKDTLTTSEPAQATSSGGGLLGGLVGGVLDVVGGTLSTVTGTVGAVTETLSHTVLAPLTQPPAGNPDAPVLLPLDDLLGPVLGSGSNSGGVTATVPGAPAGSTPGQDTTVVEPTVSEAVTAQQLVLQTGRVAAGHLVVRHAESLPEAQEQPGDSGTHATGGGGDSTPGLPGGTPAPSAPAPTAAPGHDGPGGARHAFAVHTDDVTTTQLKLIGTSRDHEVDGAGREAALPTTSPD